MSAARRPMIDSWHDTVVCLSVLRVTLFVVKFRVGVRVESSSPDTFAVGLSFSHTTAHRETPNRSNFPVGNSHGQNGHVTIAIPDAEVSAVRF